jgi:predicted membrane protein
MKKRNQNMVVSILFVVLLIVSLIYYFTLGGSYWLLLAVLSVSAAIFAFLTYLYDLTEKKQFLINALFFVLFGLISLFSYIGDRNNNNIFWIAFSIYFVIFNLWHYLRASEYQKNQNEEKTESRIE